MATRKKKAASSNKKSTPKQVIEHDPFSMSEEETDVASSEQTEHVMEEIAAVSDEVTEDSPAPSEVSACIDLTGSLIINEVEIHRNTLINALQEGGDLMLDGGEIEQIDGAGLQLLAAFAKEAEKTGISYKWNSVSPVLCEAAKQLGLTEVLQLNEAC